MTNRTGKVFALGLAVLLSVLGLLYGWLMNPHAAGYLYDDGMYLMAGQSLAAGQGYTLPGIAGQPVFHKYPPLYPALLALGWWVFPAWPHGIPWFKSVNILLSLGALGLVAVYYRRVQAFPIWLALGLVAVLGLNWRLAEVSVELMSEPFYLLLSVLLVLSVDGSNSGNPTRRNLIAWTLLAVLAFYIRSVGLVFALALLLWLALRGQRRAAVMVAAAWAGLAAPWFLHSLSQPASVTAVGDFLLRSFQESYFQSMRLDLRYEYGPVELYGRGLNELWGNLSIHFLPLLERLWTPGSVPWADAAILSASLLFAVPLGLRAWSGVRDRQASLAGIYVSLYLLILPFWSFFRFYPRFIVVILPFLLGMLFSQLRRYRPGQPAWVAASLLGVMLIANFVYLWPYLAKAGESPLAVNAPGGVSLREEYEAAFAWIRGNTPPGAVLYTDNGDEAFFVALQTGRPTVDFFLFLPPERLALGDDLVASLRQAAMRRAEALQTLLRARGVTYVVENSVAVIKSPVNSRLIADKPFRDIAYLRFLHPEAWQPVFTSSAGAVTVYRLSSDALPPGPESH